MQKVASQFYGPAWSAECCVGACSAPEAAAAAVLPSAALPADAARCTGGGSTPRLRSLLFRRSLKLSRMKT